MIARVHKEEERRDHARWSLATYLGLCGRVLILTVGGGAQGGTRSVLTSADASSLCQVLLTLCLSNLDLLLLTTAAKLIWLEGVLGFELGPSMLGDVALSHGCDAAALCCDVGVLTFCWRGRDEHDGVAGWLGWVTCVDAVVGLVGNETKTLLRRQVVRGCRMHTRGWGVMGCSGYVPIDAVWWMTTTG